MQNIKNAEFKARVKNLQLLEEKLISLSPTYLGEDHQKDTYYLVPSGRLKLREGNIENALIWYQRENVFGIKRSDIILYKYHPDNNLKLILERSIGIKQIVEKIRRIYFIENVKIHFDRVQGLGDFLEVEAIDESGGFDQKMLEEQCREYSAFFNIEPADFIDLSYSDLLLSHWEGKNIYSN
jgi:adenylate cyclase, class 2